MSQPHEPDVLRKVAWRLVPFLCLLYVFNIVDRANVGFARVKMQDDLGMSDAVFDLGFGIFYLGYLLFEVPANLLLRRVGARRWIARIMITWGLVSCATMAVTGAWGFYFVRILLGVAEAGFFPGIILFLTYWFPARQRAKVTAWFMMAICLSGILSNPLNGAIMQHLDRAWGLKGWQWLFLLEGLPSVLLGVVALYYLTDNPKEADWLTPQERDWLTARLAGEEHHRRERHGGDLLPALVDWRVWLLICLYATVAVGANASGAHFPKLIKERFGGNDLVVIGLLAALPHVCALLTMTVVAWSSDRSGERRGHVAFSALLAASGWGLAAVTDEPWLALLGFCLAQAGMMSMLPTFWALPTSFLSGAAAAGGIALINSVGNIGGLFAPTILSQFGLGTVALILVAGALLALCVRHDATLERGGGQTRPFVPEADLSRAPVADLGPGKDSQDVAARDQVR